MTTLTAKQIYDLSLQQIAAESFLDVSASSQYSGEALKDVLRLGSNNPAIATNRPTAELLDGKTRMTEAQITDFTTNYDIIAHQANTASGFSGTLFKSKTTGDYTLSFRSTEFADDVKGGDWSRDGVAGADGEMANYGFALAQIADMEAWFRELRGDRPKAGGAYSTLLPGSANYNVTGYSLGGHLATVFTEAHQDDPKLQHTYLFNAPGRGGLPNRGLNTVKQFVDGLYDAYSAAGFTLIDGVGLSSRINDRGAQAASAAHSCGRAAKSLRSGCGLRGQQSQCTAKGKNHSCHRPDIRSGSQSTAYGFSRTAPTNDLRGAA